jgi:hypothetical protein
LKQEKELVRKANKEMKVAHDRLTTKYNVLK